MKAEKSLQEKLHRLADGLWLLKWYDDVWNEADEAFLRLPKRDRKPERPGPGLCVRPVSGDGPCSRRKTSVHGALTSRCVAAIPDHTHTYDEIGSAGRLLQ